MKSGGGGNIFYYDSGGSGSTEIFWGCFRALRQLLVQFEAKFFIELLNICG